jgi:hypothetical protein
MYLMKRLSDKTISVYKSKLKWLFIAGFICGATLGTAIVEMWIK